MQKDFIITFPYNFLIHTKLYIVLNYLKNRLGNLTEKTQILIRYTSYSIIEAMHGAHEQIDQ